MTIDVDALAQFMRRIDGRHSLGAGALAEQIVAWLDEHPAPQPERQRTEDPRLRRISFAEMFRDLPERQPESEPTEAQIEAAAQRMCRLKADRLSLDFDYLWQQAKDGLIEEARAVLRAALAAKDER